jgi:hypothetical protein
MSRFNEFRDLVGEPPGLASNEDAFGFLWCDSSRSAPPRLSTPDLRVEPLDDWQERTACFDSLLVNDRNMRILYPPTTVVTRQGSAGAWVTVPGTSHPAELYPPAVSHKLILPTGANAQSLRNVETFFVIQFLGYLYDTRLMFWDWRLDTRVVIGRRNSSFLCVNAEPLVSKALARYRALDRKRQLLLTNMLYLSSRGDHVFWEWERFWHEFMVFDSVRAFLANPSKPNFKDAVEQLGVCFDQDRVHRMRTLRNDLSHEGLWSRDIPGFAASDLPIYELRGLNERLIAGWGSALPFDGQFGGTEGLIC